MKKSCNSLILLVAVIIQTFSTGVSADQAAVSRCMEKAKTQYEKKLKSAQFYYNWSTKFCKSYRGDSKTKCMIKAESKKNISRTEAMSKKIKAEQHCRKKA